MLLAHVTPADVIGEALRLHLGPTAWPAVASRSFTVGSHEVLLEVLAASHRVSVRPAGAAAATLVETVACGAASTPPVDSEQLPVRHVAALARATYQFESATRFGPDGVERAAREVRHVDHGLQVAFPGHPDALTGIRLQPQDPTGDTEPSITWTTWHVYPGTLPHVVTTSSTFTPDGRSR